MDYCHARVSQLVDRTVTTLSSLTSSSQHCHNTVLTHLANGAVFTSVLLTTSTRHCGHVMPLLTGCPYFNGSISRSYIVCGVKPATRECPAWRHGSGILHRHDSCTKRSPVFASRVNPNPNPGYDSSASLLNCMKLVFPLLKKLTSILCMTPVTHLCHTSLISPLLT